MSLLRRLPWRESRKLALLVPSSRFISSSSSRSAELDYGLEGMLSTPSAAPEIPNHIAFEPSPEVRKSRHERDLRRKVKQIGSRTDKPYDADQLLLHPPDVKDLSLELLMASQTHMGHHKSMWKPANARYIFGVREDIHIISLEETAAHLRRATRLVERVAYHGGTILFVGTRKDHMPIIIRAAGMSKSSMLFTRWRPGSLTNSIPLLGKRLLKVVNELDVEVKGFQPYFARALPLAPDMVICLNPLENYVLLSECGQKNIPTVGIVDTNCDPAWVTYAIPANDDSLRSVALIACMLGRAVQQGREARFAAAREGVVTWDHDNKLNSYINKAEDVKWEDEATSKRKEEVRKLGRLGANSTDADLLRMRQLLENGDNW